jgi:hypothetical protein
MSGMSKDAFIAWLTGRVKEDEDGCWIWQGATANEGRSPRAQKAGKIFYVRRVLHDLMHPKTPLRDGQCPGSTCGKYLCCHPDHSIKSNRSKVQKGKPKSAAHRAAIAMARRANAKITDEQVREIRQMEGSSRQVAAIYGIDDTYVSQLRRHKSWKDYGNPFAGLFSANDSQRARA